MGRSMAMVGTGPMPGSTPISVPSRQPSRQYARFSSVNATENPRARCSNNSMVCDFPLSDEGGPQREDESQALDECQPYEQHETDPVDGGYLPVEDVAGKTAEEHQQEHADVDAQVIQQQAAERDAAKEDEHDAPVEFFDGGFFRFFCRGAHGHVCPE